VAAGQIPNGVLTRTRFVTVEARNNGTACPALVESVPCKNTTADTCSQSCVLSEWSSTPCSRTCGEGVQSRMRTVLQAPFGNGTACGALQEAVPCTNANECPTNCRVGSWSDFGACAFPNVANSKNGTCGPSGTGSQTRTRPVTTPAQNGGDECPALSEAMPCENPCPVDCVLSSWSDFGQCSFSCGPNGRQSRTLSESQPCNTQIACTVAVDCVVGPWVNVGRCSKAKCGGGQQARSRTITVSPSPTGAACPAYQHADDNDHF
jgi:hypothetical protein